jgi:hypothetical protein
MYAQGTRPHIRAALKHSATTEEGMEVLKVGVAQGVPACNVGLLTRKEESEQFEATAGTGGTKRYTGPGLPYWAGLAASGRPKR